MKVYILRLTLNAVVWLSSRHRQIGIEDWLASLLFICAGWIVLAYPHLMEFYKEIVASNFSALIAPFLALFILLIGSLVPITYILKLRRLGITDADHSVSSGIDYAKSLKSVKNGFSFIGVSGAKLVASDEEFREAVKKTSQHHGNIRMILLDPESDAFNELEKIDSTSGYKARADGSRVFLDAIGQSLKVIKIHNYSANKVQEMKPFRVFLTDDACLVSPFVQGTGDRNQGRGLPQIRISSRSFPYGNEPTLYTSFANYFEASWQRSENE